MHELLQWCSTRVSLRIEEEQTRSGELRGLLSRIPLLPRFLLDRPCSQQLQATVLSQFTEQVGSTDNATEKNTRRVIVLGGEVKRESLELEDLLRCKV